MFACVRMCGVSELLGYSPPGTNIVMLLPFNNIWSNLVIFRPSAVTSLHVCVCTRVFVCVGEGRGYSQFCDIFQNHV